MTASRGILIVESNVDAGEALRALLEIWGHRPSVVVTGQAAIDTALRHPPDVFILDLGLDDMDGCAVVRALRSAPGGEERLILVYSGYHHREQQALDAGCDAFVLKPAVEECGDAASGYAGVGAAIRGNRRPGLQARAVESALDPSISRAIGLPGLRNLLENVGGDRWLRAVHGDVG
jgi:CheY-like chemotaxis protein